VKWAEGDLAGALAENAKLGQALTRAEPEARADLYLHYLWDRAYLLRDQADRAPAAEKAGALAQAEAARAEYGRAATAAEADGLAVLEAYFAWRSHDAAAATAAARRVDSSATRTRRICTSSPWSSTRPATPRPPPIFAPASKRPTT